MIFTLAPIYREKEKTQCIILSGPLRLRDFAVKIY